MSQNDLDAGGAANDALPVVFYFVRHGETEFNRDGLVQGWCDAPLTDEGVRVARLAGEGFAREGLSFKAAYSSDLGRAEQTLAELLDAYSKARPDLPAPLWRKADARLREWCYGGLEARPGSCMREAFTQVFGREVPFAELNERLPETANALVTADQTGKAEGWDAIVARLTSFLNEAASRVRACGGGNVVVVSHSFSIRTLMYLFDQDGTHHSLKVANGSVTQVMAGAGGFTLGATGSTKWLEG